MSFPHLTCKNWLTIPSSFLSMNYLVIFIQSIVRLKECRFQELTAGDEKKLKLSDSLVCVWLEWYYWISFFSFLQGFKIFKGIGFDDTISTHIEMSSGNITMKNYTLKIREWCFLIFKCRNKPSQHDFTSISNVWTDVFSTSSHRLFILFLSSVHFCFLKYRFSIISFLLNDTICMCTGTHAK